MAKPHGRNPLYIFNEPPRLPAAANMTAIMTNPTRLLRQAREMEPETIPMPWPCTTCQEPLERRQRPLASRKTWIPRLR